MPFLSYTIILLISDKDYDNKPCLQHFGHYKEKASSVPFGNNLHTINGGKT